MGWSPNWACLNCIVRNIPYQGVISLEIPGDISGIQLDSLVIERLENLPPGITYTIRPGNSIPGGSVACVDLMGTTSAPAMTSQMYIRVSMYAGTIVFEEFRLDSLLMDLASVLPPSFDATVFDYFLRVIEPTDNCNSGVSAPSIIGSNTPNSLDTATYSAPQQINYDYNWSVTGGNIIGGQGSNSITVQWGSPGSGTVSLTWSDPTGCAAAATINITISCDTPAIPVITGSRNTEPNTLETYSVPHQTSFTYHWAVTGGNITGGVGTNALTVQWGNAGTGSVSINLVNTNGCSSDTAKVKVDIETPSVYISERSVPNTRLAVYPIPAHNELYIDVEKPVNIVVSNILGGKVLHRTISPSATRLDISSLAPGLYMIYDPENMIIARFVKE